MILKRLRLLTAFALLALGGACSVTQEIIKTGDPELVYQHALELYDMEEWTKAINLFEMSEPYFTGTNREDSLLFYKARSRFKDADFDMAIEELDNFRRTYGRSPFLEDVEGMYALSQYYLSPVAERDQTRTMVAINSIDEFLSRYPETKQRSKFDEIRQELQARIYQKAYLNAYTYYKIGKYKSAIVAFKNAMKEYPLSHIREGVSFHIVASAYYLAHNSVARRKEDRYLEMMDSYYTFIAEFPNSKHKDEVEQMREKAERYLEAERKKRERKGSGEEAKEIEEKKKKETTWLEKLLKIKKE